MGDPIVSVILTSYNQGQWLRQAVESVLEQSYRRWELILIDNGSIDSSLAIIDEYKSHPRIKVTRYERNSPHTMICNAGVAASRGLYVSLLCSDDYYLPKKLERQVEALESLSEEYGVVYSAGYRLRPNGQLVLSPCGQHRGNVLEALLTQPQFFPPISPLVKRECHIRYPYNERLFMEGEGIYAKIALRYLFHPLPEPLVVMRDHESNQGKHIVPNLKRSVIMYNELFARPDFPDELRYLRGYALGSTYRMGGWEAIRREKNYRQGGEWLRMAVGCNPKLLQDPRVLAGLVMSLLPTPLAHACNKLLNLMVGAPMPPVAGPVMPVEGRSAPAGENLK